MSALEVAVTVSPRWDAYRARFDEAAGLIGRLRRRLADDEHGTFLVERLSCVFENLDEMLTPSAGELCSAGYAVDAALGETDRRARRLRALLGDGRDVVADEVEWGARQ